MNDRSPRPGADLSHSHHQPTTGLPAADVGRAVVDAVSSAFPAYRDFFASGEGRATRENIEIAVKMFLAPAKGAGTFDAPRLATTFEAAARMGRAEARLGRDAHDVLQAFRVGGRVVWELVVADAQRRDASGAEVAAMAGALFDFIDQLSAATIDGHQREVSAARDARRRRREALGRELLLRGSVDRREAHRIGWEVPASVVVACAPLGEEEGLVASLAAHDIVVRFVGADPPVRAVEDWGSLAVAVIACESEASRSAVLRRLAGAGAVVSPVVEIEIAPHALRWCRSVGTVGTTLDLDVAFDDVLVAADRELSRHAVSRHLGPLLDLRPTARRALLETLDSYVRHRGRQDRMARAMGVHAQTVRYRLGRLREVLGEAVDDPRLTLPLLLGIRSLLAAEDRDRASI